MIPPAEPCRGQWPRHTLSVFPHENGTWPTTKLHLRRNSSPVASALYDGRGTCSLHSKRFRRLVMVQERKWAPLRASNLSGIPTIMIPLLLHCSVSAPGLFPGTHSRRPRQMPLAREDIPHISHITSSTPPVGRM